MNTKKIFFCLLKFCGILDKRKKKVLWNVLTKIKENNNNNNSDTFKIIKFFSKRKKNN